jgi:hypothetical protein
VWLLASSMLVDDVIREVHSYWQAVCWRMMQHWKGAAIGKQCAGGRCDKGSMQLLASSVLVEDATIVVRWRRRQQQRYATIGKQCAGGRCNNGSAQHIGK